MGMAVGVEGTIAEFAVLEAHAVDPERRRVEVTIIRPGTSANGLRYSEEVLRASLPLWEGAAAFVDHPDALDLTRAGQRSLRDLVGVYGGVRYEDGVRATLQFYPGAGWAYELASAAIADRAAGGPVANVGISADMRVIRRPIRPPSGPAGPPPHPGPLPMEEGTARWEVERITRVVSADLVFQPSAGGSFDRVVEANNTNGGGGMGDVGTVLEMVDAEGTAAAAVEVGTPSAPPSNDVDPIEAVVAEARQRVDAELRRVQEARRVACGEMLRLKLDASDLPEPARAALRKEFEGRTFEASELDGRIDGLRAMLGEIFGGATVRGMGAQRAQVGMSAVDRVQAAVDRLFGVPLPDALSDVPRLSGIREAYLVITGDRGFTGRYDWENSVVREANEVTTGVLANTIANSMTKRIEHDYAAQPKWWEPLVVKTAIADFKQQQRIHLNDFAALATVAENAAYTNLAWGDTRETYIPAKRGNLVVVTLEMIVNDDTGAVVRIPQKLAAAAVVTVNEFVAALFTANGGAGSVMSDTFTVFDAANHQGNSGTAALSSASLQAALTAMLKFTNSAGKRIGVQGRYLLLPPDLFFTGQVILNSAQVPGSANNDINPVKGALVPVNVPNWTDTNNWYVMADPAQIEGIELGFLNGREEPELIVQDNPATGSVFTNDAISWKVRHVFGGGWLDYRAAYGAIVP